MRQFFVPLAIISLLFTLVPQTVFAARGAGSQPPSSTVELVGYDISYPQCGKVLPTDFYFAVVGVNGGNAATPNPCLADQLTWAYQAKDGSTQPKVQLYVNTANPGELISEISTWPTSPTDSKGNLPQNPYGSTCAGANDLACSWLYGWNRSIYTESVFKNAAASKSLNAQTSLYRWWLDVETMNTWQSGSADALRRNVAALEGAASYYQAQNAPVGLYSTAVQWADITGNYIGSTSNLRGLANWRPSGSSLANAKSNCSVAPLTAGGYIALTQYIQKGWDKNHSCL